MTKKVNGGTKAANIVKANGKTWAETKAKVVEVNLKMKAEAKPKADRRAERRSFIKQNSTTILKAWDALKGKKSGAALNRVLPSTWHNKFVDEVLMLNGLRKSGEKCVTDAVAEDKPFLNGLVTKANGKPKALVTREAKEAASVARFHATEAQVKNA